MPTFLCVLLSIIAIYWIVVAIFGLLSCRKMFQKYEKYQPIEKPDPKWEAYIRDDYSRWDRKKIYIGCVTRLPLALFVFLSFIFSCIFVLYIQGKAGHGKTMRKLANGFLATWQVIFKAIGTTVQRDYDDKTITTPIVISNHTNFFDIFMLLLGVGTLSFMAKREIQKYPLFGTCADGLFCLYVDRDSADSRNRLFEDIKSRASRFTPEKPDIYPLVIFPQGTTTNGKALLPFKIGAFDCKAPITAFYINYQYGGNCGLGMDEITQLECALLFGTNSVKATISKQVIQPFSLETGEEYMLRCQKLFSQKFGLRQVQGGFRDKIALHQYRKDSLRKKNS